MRAAPLWATSALVATGLSAPTQATETQAWGGFYTPRIERSVEPPAPRTPVQSDVSQCIAAILEAQQQYGIPNNLLLAIGVQEAGRQVDGDVTIWPWTANSQGVGVYFRSKAALESWVRAKQSSGVRSIDVGCMQINQRWHGDAFRSLEEATEPRKNADYAARFLRQLYEKTGDWWEAAGRYHSSNAEFKEIYLNKLAHNHQVAQSIVARAALPTVMPATQTDAAGAIVAKEALIGWSAEMTGTVQGRRVRQMSIYSTAPLQPFLPQYRAED